MAGFLTSGALLLIVLIGSSLGYPSKIAPARVAPAEVSEPRTEVTGVSVQPVAVSEGTSIPAPPSYAVSPAGGFQHASAQDVSWAVQPLSLLSGTGTGSASVADAQPLSYAGYPQYHAGDISQYQGSYEHGNSESETLGQGYQSQPLSVIPSSGHIYARDSEPIGTGGVGVYGAGGLGGVSVLGAGGYGDLGGFGGWPGASYLYDYMFMTGQYPPGTLTHSSESYEQGADHWQDAHYQRYYIPSYTITELQPAPVAQAPVKGQMPVKQTQSQRY